MKFFAPVILTFSSLLSVGHAEASQLDSSKNDIRLSCSFGLSDGKGFYEFLNYESEFNSNSIATQSDAAYENKPEEVFFRARSSSTDDEFRFVTAETSFISEGHGKIQVRFEVYLPDSVQMLSFQWRPKSDAIIVKAPGEVFAEFNESFIEFKPGLTFPDSKSVYTKGGLTCATSSPLEQ
jgi:hypothetical protein